MTTKQTIFDAYMDGDLTAMEALRALCSDYEELEQSYKDFGRARDGMRDQIAHVLAKLGDKVEVKGFGTVMLTAPSVTKSFDKEKIRALIQEWSADFPEFAESLAACETKSSRAGGLRIEREKAAH